jgi:ribosomal protein S18 acetylase RimI-like enzyme
MNWRERLEEYRSTSSQSRLFITSLADREIPVGVAVWSVDPLARESEVHYLGVLPAVRGRGWGRIIMQRVCSQSQTHGADSVELNVDLRNRFAIKLYESAGFRELFRRRFWISRDERLFSTGSTHESSDPVNFRGILTDLS